MILDPKWMNNLEEVDIMMVPTPCLNRDLQMMVEWYKTLSKKVNVISLMNLDRLNLSVVPFFVELLSVGRPNVGPHFRTYMWTN